MDTHTDTTERDLLMPRLMLIPPSSTTPTDMVPLVPTPMVLPLMRIRSSAIRRYCRHQQR